MSKTKLILALFCWSVLAAPALVGTDPPKPNTPEPPLALTADALAKRLADVRSKRAAAEAEWKAKAAAFDKEELSAVRALEAERKRILDLIDKLLPKPPKPPTPPYPPQPPQPPSPVIPTTEAPIPGPGNKALIVYEKDQLAALPKEQLSLMTSLDFRNLLTAKCGQNWRQWDQNVSTANESTMWQTAFSRPRKQLPWLIFSTDKTGYEGPLPANLDEAKKLINQYAP